MNAAAIATPVAAALAELAQAFGQRLASEPDGICGALVCVASARLPASWPADRGALMFVLPYNFPATPVYPYYVDASLAGSAQLAQGMQVVQWRERSVVQLSLRQNRWRPGLDTVVGSVLQAMDWLASR